MTNSIANIKRKDTICINNSEDRKEILREYHILLGHGSENNMNFSIRKKYFWSGLTVDIKKFVEQCKLCSLVGNERINTKNRIIETTRPNEIWEVDLIGRLESSKGNNKFIFCAIDHYTKWLETRILETKDAQNTVKAIKELIFEKPGIPKTIISDNGLEFKNELTKSLIDKYKFDWKYNSPGHHETVGLVERVNQTIMRKLSKLSNIFTSSWETKLEAATMAVNLSYNRAIKSSPYLIKYGVLPNFNIDKKLGKINYSEPLVEVRNCRDKHFEHYSKKNIEKGRILCKYDMKIGDEVAVFRESANKKLESNWKPGYKIVEKIEPDAYIVEKTAKNTEQTKNM